MEYVAVQMPERIATVRTEPPTDPSGGLAPRAKSSKRTGSWSSRVSSPTILTDVAAACAARTLDAYDFTRTQLINRGGVIARIAGIAGFVIACVALWSTLSAMDDSRRAVSLAEWTARKDFLEFCQSNDYKTPGCEDAKGMSLGPPPRFIGRDVGWPHPGNKPTSTLLGCSASYPRIPLFSTLRQLFSRRGGYCDSAAMVDGGWDRHSLDPDWHELTGDLWEVAEYDKHFRILKDLQQVGFDLDWWPRGFKGRETLEDTRCDNCSDGHGGEL